MKIKTLFLVAETGDVLLVRGKTLIGKFIRVFSGEGNSHVAVIIKEPAKNGDLYVYEFVESVGFHRMTLANWLAKRKGQIIFYGVAPDEVNKNRNKVYQRAIVWADMPRWRRQYGWFSFPVIWVSQIFNFKVPNLIKVCSTFVQDLYETTTFKFGRNMEPGDFDEVVPIRFRIEFEN